MKTHRQILETIHDSVLEDLMRMEIAIRNLDDKKDDEVIDRFSERTQFGVNEKEITKKDMIKDYKGRIAKREHALKTIERLINEDEQKDKKANKGADHTKD